jgi:hypothetical protein
MPEGSSCQNFLVVGTTLVFFPYNKNQLDALISQIYFGNEALHVSDSSSVHHRELFTVHSAMVYVIQVCRQLLSSRIRMELQFYPDPAALYLRL